MSHEFFRLEYQGTVCVLRLCSADGTNRLTRDCVRALYDAVTELACEAQPLIFTGNYRFFSAGADLREIAALSASAALQFARTGQLLMNAIADFPAPAYAAISGYCMGGGLDLALACHYRIAAANVIFGHRGAALGLITGWGGTQRLPRLLGTARALEIFMTAEKIHAARALTLNLVDLIADDPVAEAIRRISSSQPRNRVGEQDSIIP
jgi:enoyl-CoA hydratase